MNYNKRVNQIQEQLASQNLDAFITLCPENYFYLSGFSGSSGALLITKDALVLITDSRYETQVKEETAQTKLEIIIHKGPLMEACIKIIRKLEIKKLGFEADRLLVIEKAELKNANAELHPQVKFIEKLRAIKDEFEIIKIRKAVRVIETVFEEMLTYVKPGITEIDLAVQMEMRIRQLGGSGTSFDTIVASGIRGALPHGIPTTKKLETGEFILVDFGAIVDGYCSDMTRTFCLGTLKQEKMGDIYNAVLEAQLKSSSAISSGKTGKEIDTIARNSIIEAGYGAYFGHGLGHSVGIEIHERPLLNPQEESILEEGMVVTVEPGIYIEGIGGVRIEDMVLVQKDTNDNLMTLPKTLFIV
ncbi:MAG: M24 family metallopeptidase [Culicoidibacterales bacterium]